MKKLLFFIVALQVLTSGNFLQELSKFDDLYQHFIEHKNSKEPLTVVQFIHSHYFDNMHENADPVKHAKLPLRNTGSPVSHVYLTPVEGFSLEAFFFDPIFDFTPTAKWLVPQCGQCPVFQPPKCS